ncbi:glycosyltransferase family 2 protein [Gluconobacter aidae]|uniref:Glycosyltransferase n=1 Tax=Gluconobacter aidae TaxID=2662454 RepID=A0A7X1VNI7_9PROT|nr:glycosyltransferase [Gluconobacter aidae]MQR99853.1 glycosyltransferase [Gluconobacter aidae]
MRPETALLHPKKSIALLPKSSETTSVPANAKVVVGIATTGRPEILAELVDQLAKQSILPHRLIISYARPGDIAAIPQALRDSMSVEFVTGHMGAAVQRNVILDRIENEDIILFLDDDFFPHPAYISRIIEAFHSHPDVLGATGHLLADGARGPGLEIADANRLNENVETTPLLQVEDAFNTYGCNMAFRCSAIKRLGTRFDENLPLYSWYEDMDFSRSLLPHGRIVRVNGARGVHLGNKTGKGSGIRLGYSQIINSIYLARKGTYPWSHALKSAGRHFLINALKSFRPEPYIDRRGRLRGNLIGIGDVVRNRITPERAAILTISKVAS